MHISTAPDVKVDDYGLEIGISGTISAPLESEKIRVTGDEVPLQWLYLTIRP